MRLTPDLIDKADVTLNATHEVELCLRGNKIPAIENLGVTEDYHEAIDLSDNEITKVENFPLLTRLRSIYLSNNRVTRIASDLHEALPNLDTLVLSSNRINRLGDLDPLKTFTKLRSLSLLNNPVTRVQHYRIYVVNLLPQLKLLDFSKVKWKERLLARKLFGGKKGEKIRETFSTYQTFVPGEGVQQSSSSSSSSVKTEEVKAAIQGATNLSEIKQIEAALITGDSLSKFTKESKGKMEDTSSTTSEESDGPAQENGVSKEKEPEDLEMVDGKSEET